MESNGFLTHEDGEYGSKAGLFQEIIKLYIMI